MSVFNQNPRTHAEVLFIKGDKHFNQWSQDATCRHCVQHRVRVPPEALCEARRAVLARYLVEEAADTYYVIVTRQHRARDDVALRADVNLRVSENWMLNKKRTGW